MRSTMQRWAVGVLALGMGLGVGTARGTVVSSTEWIGTPGQSGDWFNPGNWQGGAAPVAGQFVTIRNGGGAVISGGEAKAGQTHLAGEFGDPWDLTLLGGTLDLGGWSLTMDRVAGLKVVGGTLRAGQLRTNLNERSNNRIQQLGGVVELAGTLHLDGAPQGMGGGYYIADVMPVGPSLAVERIPGAEYRLDGGLLSTQASRVGTQGYAAMYQNGGEHRVSGVLTIGGPVLEQLPVWDGPVAQTTVGIGEPGGVVGGPADWIYLPSPGPSRGIYALSGGVVSADSVRVDRTGLLNQSGGQIETRLLGVAGGGQYLLVGGSLRTQVTGLAGQAGCQPANFVQTGGWHETGVLSIGNSWITDALYGISGKADTYMLMGGTLKASMVGVGDMVTYTGGHITVFEDGHTAELPLLLPSRDASLILQGGTLMADEVNVGTKLLPGLGDSYKHTLAITSNQAKVLVNKSIGFGTSAVFTAAPGATITITDGTSEWVDPVFYLQSTGLGSGDSLGRVGYPVTVAFDNRSTDPRAMSGLENLRLVFSGMGTAAHPEWYAYLEVAGKDLGDIAAGFEDNFAIDTLVIGDGRAARVSLVNVFDNQPDWAGDEAIYVDHLVLSAGSVLLLNGQHIYYRTLELGAGAQIFGGLLMNIPEPGSAVGLTVMSLLMLRRRRSA